MQRLERAGVITGYRLEIDPASLAVPVTAFARIRPAPGQLPKMAKVAAGLPQISECHRITGEDCFIGKVQPLRWTNSRPRSTSSCSTA